MLDNFLSFPLKGKRLMARQEMIAGIFAYTVVDEEGNALSGVQRVIPVLDLTGKRPYWEADVTIRCRISQAKTRRRRRRVTTK
jgi:hypothetical protein